MFIMIFYRAMHMHSANYAVARCLFLCLSVRPSVCPSVRHTSVFCLNDYTILNVFYRRVAPPF